LPPTAAAARSLASCTYRYRVDAKTVQDVDAKEIGGGRQTSIIDRSGRRRRSEKTERRLPMEGASAPVLAMSESVTMVTRLR